MQPSNTLYVGLDVDKDALAVADVATAHDAEVIDLGTMSTRQCDLAHRVRTLPCTATPLVFVAEAGPWGYWRCRELTTTGEGCGVVAPARSPTQAGARVPTDRRDAVPRARLRRAGERPRVDGPPLEAAAMRDRTRARADALRELKAATLRLTAFWLRHESR